MWSGETIAFVKEINKDLIVMVDNCYGEFVEEKEPSEVGADMIVGPWSRIRVEVLHRSVDISVEEAIWSSSVHTDLQHQGLEKK